MDGWMDIDICIAPLEEGYSEALWFALCVVSRINHSGGRIWWLILTIMVSICFVSVSKSGACWWFCTSRVAPPQYGVTFSLLHIGLSDSHRRNANTIALVSLPCGRLLAHTRQQSQHDCRHHEHNCYLLNFGCEILGWDYSCVSGSLTA